MQFKSKLISVLLAATLAAGGTALAADTKPPQAPTTGAKGADRTDMNGMMQGGMGGMMQGDGARSGDGMMHGGMMNMMDMMDGCGRMMHGSPSSMHPMMPQLPPGNEKLQLQMHAEMMQKMGEILANYAARLPDAPKSAR